MTFMKRTALFKHLSVFAICLAMPLSLCSCAGSSSNEHDATAISAVDDHGATTVSTGDGSDAEAIPTVDEHSPCEFDFVITLYKTDEETFYKDLDAAIQLVTRGDYAPGFQRHYHDRVCEFYRSNFANTNYEKCVIGAFYNYDIILENIDGYYARLTICHSFGE